MKFMSCSNEKNKIFCGTKHPTIEKVKKYKREMSRWIDDDKSVYIREDLADRIIRYINQGVIKATGFRKNLDVVNDKSIRIKRETIAIIMEIFAK